MRASRLWPLVGALSAAGCNEPVKHLPEGQPTPAGSPDALAASARVTDRFATTMGDLAVAPLEHATLLFVWRGRAIYVDPVTPTVDDESLPKADVVLVTDAHYDHLDPVALAKVRKTAGGTVVVGAPSVGARASVDVVLHEGEARALGPGLGVVAVPAYGVARGAGPGLLYHPRGKAVGYLLDFAGTRVYVSGDTECTPEVRNLGDVDIAFVSLNAPYAMTAAEATACVAAFRPRVVFPYAYRHAVPFVLDLAALGKGIDVRRRDFYPRASGCRARAYIAFTRGQWGTADDLLDEAKRFDPEGDADWRVQRTRWWLKECERPWPW